MVIKNRCFLGILLLVIMIWRVYGQQEDIIVLRGIPNILPPEIEKRVARLTVNLVFNRAPIDYWVNYNKKLKRIAIEFIGVHLVDSGATISGTEILDSLLIENGATDLALNNKIARLSMLLDEGWHYESWIVGRNTIRLQLWTTLNPEKSFGKKQRRPSVRYIIK